MQTNSEEFMHPAHSPIMMRLSLPVTIRKQSRTLPLILTGLSLITRMQKFLIE